MLGNCLVIYIVRTNQELKSTTFRLIINLACADLMTTMVVYPGFIKYLFLGFSWLPGELGSVLCKLAVYLTLVFFLASIFTLTGIAVDRYLAVSRPLHYHAFSHWTKVVIPGIWLASALIPLTTWFEMDTFPNQLESTYCFNEQVSVGIQVVVGICFLVPMTAMCILYPIISWRLWKRRVPGENAAGQQQTAHLMARKITKMMVTVVVVFFLCWSPEFVMIWLHSFASDLAASLPPWLIPLVIWLEILNCAMNPVIYPVFNESFKRDFNKFFCCRNSSGKRRNRTHVARDSQRSHRTDAF